MEFVSNFGMRVAKRFEEQHLALPARHIGVRIAQHEADIPQRRFKS